MRRLPVLAGVAAAVLAGVAGPAGAQDIDMSKGGPIDVTSRDGMEWRQNEMMVVARGDARAVRGTVTVTADTLIADTGRRGRSRARRLRRRPYRRRMARRGPLRIRVPTRSTGSRRSAT